MGERALSAREDPAQCAWCGAGAHLTAARLATCPSCGGATTYPPPSDDELERAYAGWYRPDSGRFAGGGDRILALSRASLARRLDRIAPAGPILDVGSGDGVLLKGLRARGREAIGLERSGVARDGVLPVEIVDFDERPGEWAAVIFWHSLEHLREPASAVDRATALLKPGGVLAIAVPNLASWQSRVFGERWFHLDLPRHLVHLPASTLTAGIESRGFEIKRVSHWRGGQLAFGWLHGVVRTLPGNPDLYSAIRRPEAQSRQTTGSRRALALGVAALAAPAAAALAGAEAAARAGGTVYVEARKR